MLAFSGNTNSSMNANNSDPLVSPKLTTFRNERIVPQSNVSSVIAVNSTTDLPKESGTRWGKAFDQNAKINESNSRINNEQISNTNELNSRIGDVF